MTSFFTDAYKAVVRQRAIRGNCFDMCTVKTLKKLKGYHGFGVSD